MDGIPEGFSVEKFYHLELKAIIEQLTRIADVLEKISRYMPGHTEHREDPALPDGWICTIAPGDNT